jgi:hypothetical protein
MNDVLIMISLHEEAVGLKAVVKFLRFAARGLSIIAPTVACVKCIS